MGNVDNITSTDLSPVWSRLDIPIVNMAAAVGVSRRTLSSHAQKLGLPSRAGNPGTKKCGDAEFARAWISGVSRKQMAVDFGYTNLQAITSRRRRMGLTPRNKGATP